MEQNNMQTLKEKYENQKQLCKTLAQNLEESAQKISAIEKQFENNQDVAMFKKLCVERFFENINLNDLNAKFSNTDNQNFQKIVYTSAHKVELLDDKINDLMKIPACKQFSVFIPTILNYYSIKKQYEKALVARLDLKQQIQSLEQQK
jgi:archaellum component FlaC